LANPNEVLDDALGLGVGGLAEVGREAVPGGEPDVSGGGHDDVGHDAALEAAHPVGEDDRPHPAERLEALGQQTQRRGLGLVGREADEADAAPSQDRAEDMEVALAAPVDDQVLARDRHPRPVCPAVASPGGLGPGDRPAQVAGRAVVPGRLADRQQALGADPAVGRLDPLGDERRERVGVARPGRSLRRRPVAPLDDPADRLVGRPA